MSEFEWFAFDIKAFIADTMRLDAGGKGAYLMMLIDYYQHSGGCRADDGVITAVTGITDPEAWRRLKPELMELFEVRDGRLWHARCEEELSKARQVVARTTANREQQSEAGKASAAKRWGNAKGNARSNGEDNARHNVRDANIVHKNKEEEESSLREPKKKAADAAPPALDRPLPSDFSLNPEDLTRCLADGADAPWVWDVFEQWKAYHLEQGTLTTDWKAAWWRRWERSKPPDKVEPPKPKARVVVTTTPKAAKTKLPVDWQPNDNNAAVCAEEGYDLDAMAEHFRDVCGANGYRYINHHQAFSNFIRNQKNFTRGNSHVRPKGSIIESARRSGAILDAKIREAEADEARARDGDQPVPRLSED